ncbi:hypothetical protein C8R46DRAFT_1055359 [Mycena filopes]|nr:hypothetical protein C8R46DRAFT_1055359 [Mycena filopes]
MFEGHQWQCQLEFRSTAMVDSVPGAASVYPVLTLPTEIVTEIFINFLPAYPLCPPLVGLLSPTLLTHICSLWREIALQTPALWRAIDLSLFDVPVRHQVRVATVWLLRSRCYPLSLIVGNATDGVNGFIETIVTHRSRWEHLDVFLIPPNRAILEGPLPLLRNLSATIAFEPDSSPAQDGVPILEAPLLRSVRIDDIAAKSVMLPWAQLASVTLDRVYPSECLPLFTQASSLVYCELQLFHEDPPDVPPVISLPHLETLIMKEGYGTEAVTGYLDTFLVPALSTLQVAESFLGEDPIGYIRSFTSNSRCSLRDMIVTGKTLLSLASYQAAFPAFPVSS